MRLRAAILPLFTALIVPAFGETATTSCQSWNASYCDAEFARARNAEINASIAAVMAAREQAFAAARNAEIEASIITVQAARASEFALNRTSCESPDANLPPCEGEIAARFANARNAEIKAALAAVDGQREMRFAAARNAEIDASIMAVDMTRMQPVSRSRCETPDDVSLSPCIGEVATNFAAERNAEIKASMAAAAAARDILFAQVRNNEINASIAAVKAARARDYALASTAEMLAWANTLRGDRAQRFAAARNAEIDASIAAVKAARERDLALSLTHCKMPNSQTPRCAAERAREFAAARNAEAAASLAAVAAERDRRFAQARNAEITASIATVEITRARLAALSTTHCNGNAITPRCEAERNRELALSLTHCQTPNSRTPRCEAERAREFAAARNAEITASLAAVTAARERSFAEARNAEINAAMSAYQAERTIRAAQAQTPANPQSPPLETGTIRVPELQAEPVLPLRHSISDENCPATRLHLMPVQFSGPGATVDDAMRPGLDVIAAVAKDCPAVHIEIHGYSDSFSAVHVSRLLSELRAKAAMAYLVSAGVSADRMIAIGHGDMIPLAANTTEENRAKNRRVEFTVKDPTMQAGVRRVMWELAELLDPTYVPQLADLGP